MGGLYPTPRDYRGKRGGTVRAPRPPGAGQPRRPPGRPSGRPNRPSYRPAPATAKPPAVKAPPGLGGALRALRGYGPLSAAFGVGYALGSIIFRPGELGWNIPDYAAMGYTTVYGECPVGPGPVLAGWNTSTFCGPGGGEPTPDPNYKLSFGVDTWWFGFEWPPGTVYPADWTHGANLQVSRFPSQGDSIPYPELVNAPGSIIVTDPALLDGLGRPVWYDPAAAPIAAPGVPGIGPVAPPVTKGKIRLPGAGVGNEGYEAGEPGGNARPVTRPLPRPNPARTPPRTKERKIKGPLALQLLAARGLYGDVTELQDAVDVLHDSLDKACLRAKGARKAGPVWQKDAPGLARDGKSWRRIWNGKFSEWRREKGAYRAASLAEKTETIGRNFDCVDLGKAAVGLIWQQAEDRILGSLGNKAREAAERGNNGPLPRGFELGPAL